MTSSATAILGHRLFASIFVAIALTGCGPARLRPELEKSAANALTLSDALEELIAQGTATDEDRDAAYDLVQKLPSTTAGDAFGHAAIAGRVAEKKGATSLFSDKNPTSLVEEAEQFAIASRKLDPNFRDGAATRMLGTLYVLAPADMLKHGDSEAGLSMLEHLVQAKPEVPVNQLRLAEAYIALGDKDPGKGPLCKAEAARSNLRPDDRTLLDKLEKDMKPFQCPSASAPAASSSMPAGTAPASSAAASAPPAATASAAPAP